MSTTPHARRECSRRGEPVRIWLTGGARSALQPAHGRSGSSLLHPGQRPRLLLAEATSCGSTLDGRHRRSSARSRSASRSRAGAAPRAPRDDRLQLKVGNRDVYGARLRVDRRGRRSPRASIRADAVVARAPRVGQLLRHLVELRRRRARSLADGPASAWTALGRAAGGRAARDERSRELEKGEIGDDQLRASSSCASTLRAPRAATASPRGAASAERARRASAPTLRSRVRAESLPRLDELREAPTAQLVLAAGGRRGQGDPARRDRARVSARTRMGGLGKLGALPGQALGVRRRRPARVEHRGRHLPGHLRHRDDGAAS